MLQVGLETSSLGCSFAQLCSHPRDRRMSLIVPFASKDGRKINRDWSVLQLRGSAGSPELEILMSYILLMREASEAGREE